MKTDYNDLTLILGDSPVIAQGNRQFVFEHPQNPALLLKIPQPDTMDANANLLTDRWFDRRFRRATAYKGFLREFKESLYLMARISDRSVQMLVCQVFGTVQTDKGLALVYERISEPNGQLSPSLAQLIAAGSIAQRHLDDLENHFDQLSQERVAISNQNPGNLVYQSKEDGSGRWVWIDSFGSKQSIPLRRWVRAANDRKLNQVRRHFIDMAEAAWRKSQTGLG